jgi:putative dimethyl sulfoxide reductase chaperone
MTQEPVVDAVFDPEVAELLSCDLNFLARLHDREADADLLTFMLRQDPQDWFGLKLAGPEYEEGARLIRIALAQVSMSPNEGLLDDLAADYAAIYLTHAYRASPCESFWRDEDNLERQEPMFEARAWYEKFGLGAPDWRKRSDDHIAFELQFLALMLSKGSDAAATKGAAEFLKLHPMRWIPDFTRRVVSRCQEPFYAGAALLTLAYLQRLCDLFAQAFDFDMTIPPEDKPTSCGDGDRRPTCADPPAEYREGLA